ncbi:MAG TPA: glycosyl transferase [Chitinophagaceae bacterium]|jgi:poly-beta-1,6-N-acetyl-D-glucosamine synthase|nr:glycosyl transferase [Chitinophagaceae bacterium]
MMLRFLFFFSFLLVFYCYIGYGILIYLLVKLKKLFPSNSTLQPVPDFEPEITLVVAAYNEADFIERKIRNSLELDYPTGKLRMIFITDGSTDGTPEIIREFSQILLLHQPERKGKVAAMNRAIKYVETPYVIFSDANTLLNTSCVREIVKHYIDPRVGGVAGEKKIISKQKDMAAGAGEGIYWKYESLLKKLDSEFYTVVGAAGELFSVKTELFHEAAEDTIIEDFVQSLQICMEGYVIRYEPRAFAVETASATMREEQKRKIRIAAGAFQAMRILKNLFNFRRYPVLSFQYISHRVLRWTLCPISLIVCFISNFLLVHYEAAGFYQVVLLAQIVFYAMAVTGYLFASRNLKIKALYIPYYFLFMNLSVFMGFYRFIRNKQTALWEKAARHSQH